MLKTKHAFGLLFLALFAVFAGSVYLLVGSNIDTLLFKQYEQKLKTLDDTLRFGLLEKLNSANIKEFATETRADFIIVHNGGIDFSKNASKAEFLDENSSEFKSNAEFKGENSSEIYQNNEFAEENSSKFSQI